MYNEKGIEINIENDNFNEDTLFPKLYLPIDGPEFSRTPEEDDQLYALMDQVTQMHEKVCREMMHVKAQQEDQHDRKSRFKSHVRSK